MIIGQAEASDGVPEAMVGKPIALLSLAWMGPQAETDRVLAPLLALGEPLTGGLKPMAYLDSQHANDEAMAWGHRIYTKSGFVTDLPDELVDALVDHVASSPPGEDVFSIWAFGGAVGRVPEDADRLRGPVGALLDRRGVDVGRPRCRWRASRVGARRASA